MAIGVPIKNRLTLYQKEIIARREATGVAHLSRPHNPRPSDMVVNMHSEAPSHVEEVQTTVRKTKLAAMEIAVRNGRTYEGVMREIIKALQP